MPAKGDHDARRRDVSQAVWRVLAAEGFGGLTMRAVAAELGASTGLVTHYFPNKRALVRHAVELAEEHGRVRDHHPSTHPGLDALRAALLDVMPLTTHAADMNRVWVSFWGEALSDESLGDFEIRRYERWRGMLRPHVEAAVERGELPPGTSIDDTVATAAAFAHGVVVQALVDPARFPPERQTELVNKFVRQLNPAHQGDQLDA